MELPESVADAFDSMLLDVWQGAETSIRFKAGVIRLDGERWKSTETPEQGEALQRAVLRAMVEYVERWATNQDGDWREEPEPEALAIYQGS